MVDPAKLLESVTGPWQLAAFVLFLVFLFVGRRKSGPHQHRERMIFFALAGMTLAAALVIAFLESPAPGATDDSKAGPENVETKQETKGDNSPAISGVGGDVNFNTPAASKEQDQEAEK